MASQRVVPTRRRGWRRIAVPNLAGRGGRNVTNANSFVGTKRAAQREGASERTQTNLPTRHAPGMRLHALGMRAGLCVEDSRRATRDTWGVLRAGAGRARWHMLRARAAARGDHRRRLCTARDLGTVASQPRYRSGGRARAVADTKAATRARRRREGPAGARGRREGQARGAGARRRGGQARRARRRQGVTHREAGAGRGPRRHARGRDGGVTRGAGARLVRGRAGARAGARTRQRCAGLTRGLTRSGARGERS